jgi:hypothetical protein
MLKSFQGQLAQVESFLTKNNRADLLLPDEVTEDLINHLVTFFVAFESAVHLVEGDLEPTLQNVLPAYERLLHHCKKFESDEKVGTLATKFLQLIPVRTNLDF